jgi:hypothetical protein
MTLSLEKQLMRTFLSNAKRRAKRKNLPFNLDKDYLKSIVQTHCPVFKTSFVWECSGLGKGFTKPNSPSLDRIIPELGYVKGNMVFISHLANKIKQDATEKELYAVADWLHDKRKEVLNAFGDKLPRLPEPCVTPGRKTAACWPFPGAGPGQDCDGAQHYQAELFGTNPGGCT